MSLLYFDHTCIRAKSVHAGMCSYVLWKNAEPRLQPLQKRVSVAGGEGGVRDCMLLIAVSFILVLLCFV